MGSRTSAGAKRKIQPGLQKPRHFPVDRRVASGDLCIVRSRTVTQASTHQMHIQGGPRVSYKWRCYRVPINGRKLNG